VSYTTVKEIEIAAGGPRGLIDLADFDKDGIADEVVIRQAQRDADAWIDGYARRLYSVPFDPVPSFVKALATSETIYRLKQFIRITSDEDTRLRKEREVTLHSLEMGRFNPVDYDPYPIGTGGGTPIAAERSGTSWDDATASRISLIGYW